MMKKLIILLAALTLSIGLMLNGILFYRTYSDIMNDYENDRLIYQKNGQVSEYAELSVSPLGLYGSIRKGVFSVTLDHTNELKQLYEEDTSIPRTVFNWERLNEKTDLDAIRHTLYRGMITGIYQYAAFDDLHTEVFTALIQMTEEMGIDLWLIYDEQDMEAEGFRFFLRALAEADPEGKIRGIVTDIEPYSSLSHISSLPLQKLSSFAEEAYAMSQNAGYLLYHALPVWYDRINVDLLEKFIVCSDGIVMMNYARNSEVDDIATEVKLADLYKKTVYNAIELGNPEDNPAIEVTATYYGESLETIERSLMTIRRTYPDVGYCYHELKDLNRLYEENR